MPTSYRLGRIIIARSRNSYVVYGATSYGVRFHAQLPDSRSFYSQARAESWVREELAAGRLRAGMRIANGHHAGAERCSSRCDERFIAEVSFNGTTPAAAIIPPAVTLSIPDSLRARTPPASVVPGIVSFGVELECEVPRASEAALRELLAAIPRMQDHDDGSIRATHGGIMHEFTFWASSYDEMEQWLGVMYGQLGVTTNDSCGFHIHVRPQETLQGQFATRQYWDGFYQAYRDEQAPRAAKFEERMTCHWCQMRPWDARFVRQALRGEEDRYSAINLCSLTRHGFGTIEHRIMPHQRDAAEATESVRWLVGTASRLINTPFESEEFTVTLTVPVDRLAMVQEVLLTSGVVESAESIHVTPHSASTSVEVPVVGVEVQ